MKGLVLLFATLLLAVAAAQQSYYAKNATEGSSTDICDLPSDPGRCYALIAQYYYDKGSGSCKEFSYGGCGGNLNRFQTLSECQEKSKKCSNKSKLLARSSTSSVQSASIQRLIQSTLIGLVLVITVSSKFS